MNALPEAFLKRIQKILPAENLDSCLDCFAREKILSVRVNTLKANRDDILRIFKEKNIGFKEIPWYKEALIIDSAAQDGLDRTGLVEEGAIYTQSLSSMLSVLVLAPRPGENILDMCAAPGSKTTQAAAHMQNQGRILALDNVKGRYYKLRSVVSLLGAQIVQPKFSDARRLRPENELFDKILLDAPCSSEGRFRTSDKKTYFYWSPRKIKEMVQKQRGLILSASRILKPGGVLVYSTCTFAPEENEGVLDWLLRKTKDQMNIAPVELPLIKRYAALTTWAEKKYHPQVSHAVRVLPDESMEGFFIAKLIKRG